MVKNKIFKQGIGIAEKSLETRRGAIRKMIHIGDSVIHKHFNGVKIGIWGLHYHPSDPFFFLGFFQRSLFLFENFIF